MPFFPCYVCGSGSEVRHQTMLHGREILKVVCPQSTQHHRYVLTNGDLVPDKWLQSLDRLWK